MGKVKFLVNMEKDMENIWDKCNSKPRFGEFDIEESLVKKCKGKSLAESEKGLRKSLKKLYDSDFPDIFVETAQYAWDKIENEYFKRMNKIMKHEYRKKINAYLTSIGICSYFPDEPSFMISLYFPIQFILVTSGHEIMHLYFHEFYWDSVEEKIGEEKTGHLKEALTVILNQEFQDLWFFPDSGYEKHKELREFISEQWKKDKDFDKLLEKCVEHLR